MILLTLSCRYSFLPSSSASERPNERTVAHNFITSCGGLSFVTGAYKQIHFTAKLSECYDILQKLLESMGFAGGFSSWSLALAHTNAHTHTRRNNGDDDDEQVGIQFKWSLESGVARCKRHGYASFRILPVWRDETTNIYTQLHTHTQPYTKWQQNFLPVFHPQLLFRSGAFERGLDSFYCQQRTLRCTVSSPHTGFAVRLESMRRRPIKESSRTVACTPSARYRSRTRSVRSGSAPGPKSKTETAKGTIRSNKNWNPS